MAIPSSATVLVRTLARFADPDVEMIEQVSVVPESGMVLVWLWHA